ncbi:calcium-binding protein, partial [Asticcacaulis sp. AC402]|uniref:calcium-binding protein n=1 Tax=Asticcacaulis sp. AC402 TaxID=1282361 RepID=UPI0003C3AE78
VNGGTHYYAYDIEKVNVTGGSSPDVLRGLSGNDTLNGAGGSDNISGAGGNDLVDAGDGNDSVFAGFGNDSLTGGLGNDSLYGEDGDDLIVGGVSTDTLDGGTGIDTASYSDASGGVVVSLAVTGAQDTGSTGFDRLAGFENLIGSAFGDVLTGDEAGNQLDGRAGNDTLTGGLGNDTFHIDSATDVVIELSGGGTDLIIASIHYSLTGTALENLTLSGSEGVHASGNEVDNLLTGNTGNNVLDGQSGNDTMAGGLGDDLYQVDTAADSIVEAGGEGHDEVESTVSFTLSSDVEALTLLGSDNLNGTGNALDNVLVGNSGLNILTGGLGDDTYQIQNAGDVIVENSNEGQDQVVSLVSYTLVGNVENLSIAGLTDQTATGNVLANQIVGGIGNNLIDGALGADTMSGNLGDDTFIVEDAGDTVSEGSEQGTD